MSLRLIYPDNSQTGLGLVIAGADDSIGDLLELWQPLCDDEKVYKQFAAGQHAACVSCINNCCRTAYVTPDIIALRMMAVHTGLDIYAFADKYLDKEKRGLGLPVLLKPCPWLADDGRCGIYAARTLLCRFYLCTPLQGDLEQLVYSLTMVGMVATMQELGISPRNEGLAISSFDRLNLEEMKSWQDHPGVDAFRRAKSYYEVPLQLFL